MRVFLKVQNSGTKHECYDIYIIDPETNKYLFYDQIGVKRYKRKEILEIVIQTKFGSNSNIDYVLDESIEKCEYMLIDEEVDDLF